MAGRDSRGYRPDRVRDEEDPMGDQTYQVSAGFRGAEVEDAKTLAADLQRQATEIAKLMKDVLAAYQEANWTGADSREFARQLNDFNTLMVRRTKAMIDASREFRQAAERQAGASK
jgi:hypothetical protein